MKRMIVVIAALLVACGGGYDSAADLLRDKGCQVEYSTEAMFAEHKYTCTDGRRIVWFNTTEGRDNYEKLAREMGNAPSEKGERYLLYP